MVMEGNSMKLTEDDYKTNLNKNPVENFKEIILDMHEGIPRRYSFGFLERLIPDKKMRDYFFDEDIFVKSKDKELGQERYFLGINGIVLANNYGMHKLTVKTMRLTFYIGILTSIVTILAFFTLVATIINLLS